MITENNKIKLKAKNFKMQFKHFYILIQFGYTYLHTLYIGRVKINYILIVMKTNKNLYTKPVKEKCHSYFGIFNVIFVHEH